MDDYLADYERRKGPLPEQEQDRARQIFDGVFADHAGTADRVMGGGR
ncbi:hypothetical protein OUY22_16735 [Nonomuraea sp. MCN248]|uniref:Uncharacterized protein n=1 Tax=Nonomuraea corallina TaxID=2989783 RepID=A0ABT4SCZ3_9ACTN|nr:hypothetical protein [Nonomuraea corallina]MDA0635067.1 hypothetical protein [Nonomuraea corallina]